MPRHKNENWNLPAGTPNAEGGHTHPYDSIKCALLMDLRDELRQLNALLACPNFTGIPGTLRSIHRALRTRLPPRRCRRKHA